MSVQTLPCLTGYGVGMPFKIQYVLELVEKLLKGWKSALWSIASSIPNLSELGVDPTVDCILPSIWTTCMRRREVRPAGEGKSEAGRKPPNRTNAVQLNRSYLDLYSTHVHRQMNFLTHFFMFWDITTTPHTANNYNNDTHAHTQMLRNGQRQKDKQTSKETNREKRLRGRN